jgi:hypothetical protein
MIYQLYLQPHNSNVKIVAKYNIAATTFWRWWSTTCSLIKLVPHFLDRHLHSELAGLCQLIILVSGKIRQNTHSQYYWYVIETTGGFDVCPASVRCPCLQLYLSWERYLSLYRRGKWGKYKDEICVCCAILQKFMILNKIFPSRSNQKVHVPLEATMGDLSFKMKWNTSCFNHFWSKSSA